MHPNDVMMVRDHKEQQFEKYSSGTRTPATQTEFGVFSPIPNGSAFPTELGTNSHSKSLEGKAEDTAREKATQSCHSFPSRAAITASTGNTLFYSIDGSEENDDQFPLNKTTDVRQSVERRRIDADEILAVGEHYLVDGALYTAPVKTPMMFGRRLTRHKRDTTFLYPKSFCQIQNNLIFKITGASSLRKNLRTRYPNACSYWSSNK